MHMQRQHRSMQQNCSALAAGEIHGVCAGDDQYRLRGIGMANGRTRHELQGLAGALVHRERRCAAAITEARYWETWLLSSLSYHNAICAKLFTGLSITEHD
jgi:hypothetical protein